jgi:peptidoglycan/xylan/chitin deacetylase (PgdA/CDA1 family)
MWPQSTLLGANLTRLPPPAAERREVALTFDDGPDPAVTPTVLDLLDRYGAKASFFCIGTRVAAHPELAREITRRGHSVENHTYSHPNTFACLLPGALARQVGAAQTIVERVVGTRPQFFRAPMGLRSPLLDPVLVAAGLCYTSWTRRGYDTTSTDCDAVLRRLSARLAAGDVLLLHDRRLAARGAPVVLDVLPRLLERIATAKLRSVSLPMAAG